MLINGTYLYLDRCAHPLKYVFIIGWPGLFRDNMFTGGKSKEVLKHGNTNSVILI